MSEKVENFSLSLSIMSWINLELARNPEFKRQVEKMLQKMRHEQEREKQDKLKTAQHNKLKTAQHENLKSAQHDSLKTAQDGSCEARESGVYCLETYDFPGQCYYCRRTLHQGRKEASEWMLRRNKTNDLRILEGAKDYLAMKGPNGPVECRINRQRVGEVEKTTETWKFGGGE